MTTSALVSEDVTTDRYYFVASDAKPDPISGACPKTLKYGVGGVWKESKTGKYMPCYDPSTGAVIAHAPQCTADEVEEAIQAGVKAFPAWRDTPVTKRTQVLFKMKQLLDEHLDELTHLLRPGKRQEVGRGDGRRPQGHRGGRVRLRRAAHDEGRVADERLDRATTRSSSANRWASSPASRRGTSRP